MNLTIGSLFAGYGGLDMGVQAAIGGDVIWYSEIDKGALKIQRHRHPDVPNIGDVTTVDWDTVPRVDVLTGGSPCQDLSHAGKRAGMTAGTRSNLWVAMREGIAALRPSLVVWENVRGAYSAEADSDLEPCPGCVGDGPGVHLRALGRVLGDLADLGYDARWHGLRAADVGAPHGRFRVFLVAEPAADATDHRHQRTWLAWDGRPGPSDGDLDPAGLTLLPTPAVNDMGEGKTVDRWDEWTATMQAKHGNGNGHGKSLAIEAQRLLPTPRASDGEKGGPNQRGSSGDLMLPAAVQPSRLLPTPTTTQRGPDARLDEREGAQANLHNEAMDRWGDYAAAIERWEHFTGRPAPEPTQTSAKGNPQLSARFVEWMMGLPAGWVTDVPGITRNQALKALGNGVVPQQAAEALRVMLSWQAPA